MTTMSTRSAFVLVAILFALLNGLVASHPRVLSKKHSHKKHNHGLQTNTEALDVSEFQASSLRGSSVDSAAAGLEVMAPPARPIHISSSLRTIPHDSKAFTEGLLLHDGFLYESVGLRGKSGVRKTNVETGETEMEFTDHMGTKLFGEGIVVFGDKLYQLTYKAKKGFVLDASTFEMIDTFDFSVSTGEGWGFTHNGEHLIVSDGSHHIYFWDPDTLEEVRRIDVQDKLKEGKAVNVRRLNELEFVLGEILANIWYDTKIARINPDTGDIIGYIHLNDLHVVDKKLREDCWNGIAYDAENQELILAGKNFHNTYVVRWPPAEE